MALFCFCGQINFSKDKNTGKGYCRTHQSYRTDFDARSLAQRAMDKERKRSAIQKIRTLPHIKGEEKEALDSRNNLITQLDFLVSRYVRILAAGEDGYLNCYTCNDRIFWKEAQCSHFIKRGANMVLRFDIRYNCHAACKTCNEYKDGNLDAYAKNLELEQKGIVEQLQERARQVEKYDLHELKQLCIDMQARVNMVSKKLK